MGDMEYYLKEKKRILKRTRRRVDENINAELKEIVYWIKLAHEMFQWRTLVNTVMNLQFP